MTPFTPEASIDYTVTFTNSAKGLNGSFQSTTTATKGGEVILGSGDAFGTTNAGFRRADVQFNLEAQTVGSATVDVDRQIVSNNTATEADGNADQP